MKMKTIKGHSLLEYQAPERWKEKNGVILPSQTVMRDYLRGKDMTFEVDNPPPDIYRWGKYVTGDLPDIPKDAFVYYNKHDAEAFDYEDKTYVRINNLNALAYYVQPI